MADAVEMTPELQKSLGEVDAAMDALVEQLEWFGEEGRDDKVELLADNGHEPSVQLTAKMRLWHAIIKLSPQNCVEETWELVNSLKKYREAGYLSL